MINIEINGVKELIGDLKGFPQKLEKTVLLRMSQIAFDSAQKGAGRHSKSGALLQSLYNKPITNGRTVGHDTQRAPQAVFINFGTRPHKIVPNKRKALRWAGAGKFIFAKSVNHPGYIGDNYMVRAKDEAVAQFKNIIDRSLRESL